MSRLPHRTPVAPKGIWESLPKFPHEKHHTLLLSPLDPAVFNMEVKGRDQKPEPSQCAVRRLQTAPLPPGLCLCSDHYFASRHIEHRSIVVQDQLQEQHTTMSYDNYYNHHPHHQHQGRGQNMGEPPQPPRQSALDDCMMERNRRHPAGRRNHAPTSFYDSAYDDVIARKQAAYGGGGGGGPPQPHRPARNPSNDTMVELGPGVYARLRGAQETWSCIEHDFHIPVVCFACSLELCCIQDASYVLCPSCKTVSPIENAPHHERNGHFAGAGNGVGENGGVGLGFTFDELFKWQAEIMRRRAEGNNSMAQRGQSAQTYY